MISKNSMTDSVLRSAREAGLTTMTRNEAGDIVDGLADLIADALCAGEVVEIFGVGRLTPRQLGQRKGVNFAAEGGPVAIEIPPRKTVTFKPSAGFKKLLNAGDDTLPLASARGKKSGEVKIPAKQKAVEDPAEPKEEKTKIYRKKLPSKLGKGGEGSGEVPAALED